MTVISDTPAPDQGRIQTIAGWTLTGLFAAFMIFDAGIKLVGHPEVAKSAAALGLPAGSGFGIGVMEAVILALYLFPRTAVLGAVLVTALMGGTCAVHLLNGNPIFSHLLFGPYLAVFAWGGLWLRDPDLRRLLPIRR
ncbi:DoxX family protein [uncultured Phenylobacterium sp.]|uniref:DoxX family protein n=1 Tax=uncultured Phenylobacterium sp. TaxID=349273 RepID=UPI0025E47ECF|nr:DoxX family protein [uncultured Phenylobacterium sp.]